MLNSGIESSILQFSAMYTLQAQSQSLIAREKKEARSGLKETVDVVSIWTPWSIAKNKARREGLQSIKCELI